MHSIHVTIAFEILAIVAVIFALIKIKKEGGGAILTWAGYFALLVGVLIMICSIATGIKGMTSCKKDCNYEMHCMGKAGNAGCMGASTCMMGMHGKMCMGKTMKMCKKHGKDCDGACMGGHKMDKKGCGMKPEAENDSIPDNSASEEGGDDSPEDNDDGTDN